MIYLFEGHALDAARRELRRGEAGIVVEPQVFDLLEFLIRHRDQVVAKDDLLAGVWKGRIVSDSTLASRISAARAAIGDDGGRQRLIRTFARKGFRFVGAVREAREPAAAPPAASGGAERRPLSILCALGGAPRLDLDALVEQWGGAPTRRASDRFVACFGYPYAHEDDAERAVRAALAMTRSLDAAAPQPRIGIASGLVVVDALPGAEQELLGEAPYVASRIAAAAAPGSIVVCAETRRLIGAWFECRDVDARSSDPAAAAQVLRDNPGVNRFAALRALRCALVGRDEELALLQRRWQQAGAGEGRLMLIGGEPGIGKSRLVAALQEAIGAAPHAVMWLSCSAHRGRTALHPVVAQLEHAAGFAPGDDDATRLDKLQRALAPASDDRVLDGALFAELLSLPVATPAALSAQRRKELVLERLLARIAALSRRAPLLLVLEDAHWIDPTTSELIDLLAERIGRLRALCIVTHRPEYQPPWLGQPLVTAINLSRLGARENAALVKQVARGKALPQALLEEIVRRSDGVPLFVEELTRSVLESGALSEQGDGYRLVEPLGAQAIPASLHASLAARLERLGPARALAQTAAALGREFGYELLRAVSGLGDAELAPQLDRFVASDLVHRRGTPPLASYAFKHALVQDAAQETLLKSQRAAVHARIVDAYERDFPELLARHPDLLAHHCAEAGRWASSIEFRLAATRMALDRSAGIEAEAQVASGTALLAKLAADPQRAALEGRLLVARGDALAMTRGFASPEVMAALTRARERLDPAAQPIEALRALCGLFNYHMIRSESPSGLRLAEPWLERAAHDARAAPVVHYLVGAAHLHLGNFARAIRHLEAALALYDASDCREVAFVAGYHLRSFSLIWLGLARLFAGEWASAQATIVAAVDDARRRAHPFTLVSALLALARFRSHADDLAGAIEATEEGMSVATEQRSPYHVSRAAILRAVNLIDGGRPDAGIAAMELALGAHRATGADFQSSYNLTRLADAHARAGRLDAALDAAERALREIETSGERWWQAEALRAKGEILSALSPSRAAEGEACLRAALECARGQGARLWELHAALALAQRWSRQRRHRAAAVALLAPIVAAFGDAACLPKLEAARAILAADHDE